MQYPGYLGYGAHKADGYVGIQIVIDEKGDVESAKGISGHPYFHPMLEKASLTAKFKPTIADGKVVKKKALIFYQITLPQYVKETAIARAKLGIVNGGAIKLPKPEYSQHAKDLCASGEVKVEVEISQNGKILNSTPFSGDEVLFDAARIAAQSSTFRPLPHPSIRSKGILVFNFVPERKCVDVGNVRGKWLNAPHFSIHPHSIIQVETEVLVRLGIDVQIGKVIAARAIGGHPLNSKALETEAMKLIFRTSLINSPPIIANGFVKLRIKRDRSVEVVK